MDFLKERTARMDDEELREVFEEYADMSITGMLKDGIARVIEREYKTFYGISGSTLETIRNGIYFEMALRFYEQP